MVHSVRNSGTQGAKRWFIFVRNNHSLFLFDQYLSLPGTRYRKNRRSDTSGSKDKCRSSCIWLPLCVREQKILSWQNEALDLVFRFVVAQLKLLGWYHREHNSQWYSSRISGYPISFGVKIFGVNFRVNLGVDFWGLLNYRSSNYSDIKRKEIVKINKGPATNIWSRLSRIICRWTL